MTHDVGRSPAFLRSWPCRESLGVQPMLGHCRGAIAIANATEPTR